jgi:hypothetical protein
LLGEILAFPGVVRDRNDHFVEDGPGVIYTFLNGQYTESARFQFADTFYQHAGKGHRRVRHFAASPGKATLRVINAAGEHAVPADRARITLNGITVVTASRINRARHSLAVPVRLKADNTLAVELSGRPGAGIWVIVGAGP